MAEVERILVVGGGIAGLSVATALRQQGFAPELVERSPSWPAVGAGIHLHANGMRVLRALGVGEAVEKSGTPIRHWRFFDQRGRMLYSTNVEQMWGDVGPCIGIARTRLQQVLTAAAAPVPTRLGTSVTSLTQEEGRVQVGSSDGSTADYDLVIGADGIYSSVRRLAISAAPPEYAGTVVWRSIIASRPSGVTDFTVFMGDDRYFGQVPMGAGHTYGFGAVAGPPCDDPVHGRLARFRDRFADFGGPVPAYLAALECDQQLHVGPFELVELDCWHTGRVVLIGDAAHAHPPNMGEGGCMAMEDAFVLAEELRAASSVESALERYEARRRPRANWVQEQSRAAAEGWVLPPDLRNAALRERGDQIFRDRYRPLIATA
ncbi:MAG TPA: FAD-dependent monooxygenase [Chloroflexota bacterium]|nr:FAD-dependent monooxygenase [Chloroflexota bacterium]